MVLKLAFAWQEPPAGHADGPSSSAKQSVVIEELANTISFEPDGTGSRGQRARFALRAKYQGEVVIMVVVGPEGRVHDSRIARKVGLGLEESAMNVLPLWRFELEYLLNEKIQPEDS